MSKKEITETVDGLPGISTVCGFCENLVSMADRSCFAFNKIPDTVWIGDNDHTAPIPGDNGIQFEEAT